METCRSYLCSSFGVKKTALSNTALRSDLISGLWWTGHSLGPPIWSSVQKRIWWYSFTPYAFILLKSSFQIFPGAFIPSCILCICSGDSIAQLAASECLWAQLRPALSMPDISLLSHSTTSEWSMSSLIYSFKNSHQCSSIADSRSRITRLSLSGWDTEVCGIE